MGDFLGSLPTVLIATAGGYLLGAIPLAYLISKRHSGVDIFEIGSGLPGRVERHAKCGQAARGHGVPRRHGKGRPGDPSRQRYGGRKSVLLLPAGAAVLGHWKSMFTGFRGGDGLVTLGGSIMALFRFMDLSALRWHRSWPLVARSCRTRPCLRGLRVRHFAGVDGLFQS